MYFEFYLTLVIICYQFLSSWDKKICWLWKSKVKKRKGAKVDKDSGSFVIDCLKICNSKFLYIMLVLDWLQDEFSQETINQYLQQYFRLEAYTVGILGKNCLMKKMCKGDWGI